MGAKSGIALTSSGMVGISEPLVDGVISLLTHLLLSTPIYVLIIISYIYST